MRLGPPCCFVRPVPVYSSKPQKSKFFCLFDKELIYRQKPARADRPKKTGDRQDRECRPDPVFFQGNDPVSAQPAPPLPGLPAEQVPGQPPNQPLPPEFPARPGGLPTLAQMSAPAQQDEKAVIARALTTTFGNITQAAGILGVSRQNLSYKMKKYGLIRQDFRSV